MAALADAFSQTMGLTSRPGSVPNYAKRSTNAEKPLNQKGHQGYLYKKRRNQHFGVQPWSKRWFLIHRDQFRWYKSKSGTRVSGYINFHEIMSIEMVIRDGWGDDDEPQTISATNSNNLNYDFEHNSDLFGTYSFLVRARSRNLYLRADTHTSAKRWVKFLSSQLKMWTGRSGSPIIPRHLHAVPTEEALIKRVDMQLEQIEKLQKSDAATHESEVCFENEDSQQPKTGPLRRSTIHNTKKSALKNNDPVKASTDLDWNDTPRQEQSAWSERSSSAESKSDDMRVVRKKATYGKQQSTKSSVDQQTVRPKSEQTPHTRPKTRIGWEKESVNPYNKAFKQQQKQRPKPRDSQSPSATKWATPSNTVSKGLSRHSSGA